MPQPPLPNYPRLLPLGDSAFTLEFGAVIDPGLHARVMRLAERVQSARRTDARLAGLIDAVPSFRSLTLHFDALATDADALGAWLQAQAAEVLADRRATTPAHSGRHWYLPVCFDTDFGPDLAPLAHAKGLSPQQVVQQLTQATLRVYLIGFLPGFPYLGGLPARLALPRRATPRPQVPAHSVAVAGEMCCIYPWQCPGGWHLLGRTPLPMFQAGHADQPAWLAAGDLLRWQAVSRGEYTRLADEWAAGRLQREAFLDATDNG